MAQFHKKKAWGDGALVARAADELNLNFYEILSQQLARGSMGFLGTTASNLADANLILQIVLVALLIWGRTLAKGGKYRNHGNIWPSRWC
jgi:hypothetical protein